jgi:hypothetical protein
VGRRSLLTVVVTASALAVLACDAPFAPGSGEGAFETQPEWAVRDARAIEFALAFGYDGQYVPLPAGQRRVIRDELSWRATWEAMHALSWDQPPVPVVDFAREMVVFTTDRQDSDVTAEPHLQVVLSRGQLFVVLGQERATSICLAYFDRPMADGWSRARATVVPRHGGPVQFIRRRVDAQCEPTPLPSRIPATETTGTTPLVPRP